MMVLAFKEYAAPSKRLARELQLPYAEIKRHRFPDGESVITLPPDLPETIVVSQTLNDPNSKLVDLLLSCETARRLGVKRIILVVPYLCYMRQDIEFEPGQSISQKIIGNILAQYCDAIITVDPHLHRINHLNEAVPLNDAIAISAAPAMGDFIAANIDNPLVVGPDEESQQWVDLVCSAQPLTGIVARKQRFGDRNVVVSLPDGDYRGKHAVLVDDIISSGHTMMRAAEALHAAGVEQISALCTHALLAPGAHAAMHLAKINNLWSTDAVLDNSNQLELAPLLAEAVTRVLQTPS